MILWSRACHTFPSLGLVTLDARYPTTDEAVADAIGLCLLASGYVAIDCVSAGPSSGSSGDREERFKVAIKLDLDEFDIYEYLSRVVIWNVAEATERTSLTVLPCLMLRARKASTRRCMNVKGSNYAKGTQIWVSGCDNSLQLNELWEIFSWNVNGVTMYTLCAAYDTGLCINVKGGIAPGNLLIAWDLDELWVNSLWQFYTA